MKFATTLILALALPAGAQSNGAKLVEQGLFSAFQGLKPLAEKDQKAVLVCVATLLAKHVTFRPDGTASSIYRTDSPWAVEWRKLVVTRISSQPITEADRLNGITRRYFAHLDCDAHRDWPPKATTWSSWKSGGFVLFPSAIVVEEKNGTLTARGNSALPTFRPGPGPSITEKKPATPHNALPPGMSRMK